MGSIYSIIDSFDKLMDKIEENDGIISADIEEELAINESDLEDKLRTYKQILDAKKGEIAYNKEEIARLRMRNLSFEKASNRIKSLISIGLHKFGKKGNSGNYKLSYPDFTVYTKQTPSIEVQEDSMDILVNNQADPKNYPFVDDGNLFERGKNYFDKIGQININFKIELSALKEVMNYLNAKGIEVVYEWKFDKKSIKELDDYAQKLADEESSNPEDTKRIKTISAVMDYIGMERNLSETVIYK